MSMQVNPVLLANLGILLWTLLAVILIGWLRVGRRPDEFSAPRIESGRHGGLLLYILVAGAFVWFMGSSVLIQYLQHASAHAATQPTSLPATAPATLPITNPVSLLLLAIIPPLLGLIALVILDGLLLPRRLASLGMQPRALISGIPRGLLGILITLPLVTWSSALMERIYHHLQLQTPTVHELLNTLEGSPTDWRIGLVVLAAVIVAPLFEELLFRGHLQTLLRHVFQRWLGPILPAKLIVWLAILLTSTLFALAHPIWMAPMIFVLSVCLGYAYERTGNLWVNITMHATFNLLSITAYLLTQSMR